MMRTFLLFLILTSWLPAQTTADGFALPQPGKVFVFPRDHGSHPEFRTEWWYVTGHLDGKDGRRFGFQVTFFRQARREGGSLLHLHLAHAALLDAKTGRFVHGERLNREGWDARASETTLDVRNGNWSLRMDEATQHLHISATVKGEALMQLELEPVKTLVVFGKDGVSRKGVPASAASHYLTWPRLKTSGSVKLGAQELSVSGEAWMDHEFSSSQLEEGQVGWDWAALQLRDGREIMVYRMRRKDGTLDAASTLAVIDRDGQVRHLASDAFAWEVLGTWKSPRNGAEYPNHIRVRFENEALELRPLALDQEQDGGITQLPYWEGACDVLDAKGQSAGRAFLELAGYAGDLTRHLAPTGK
ncbi:lipocalin-like domain-containing protein [Prosthecobacter sp.]|uniref:lipocalin-like domain-containing protein n=1 Tax=Prosthecobacter sp. TaxID=1965333 RepID=UPI003783823F